MRALASRIAIPFLITAVCLEAQWQDRLFPFIQLTDDMLAEIDLRDGSIDDWVEVLGEPTLTPLDFATPPSFPRYDPSSFDFRIWLAWHDAGNHLFVVAEIVDDIHVHNEEYWIRHPEFPPTEAIVWFNVDADKSGGAMIEFGENGMPNRDVLMVPRGPEWKARPGPVSRPACRNKTGYRTGYAPSGYSLKNCPSV